MNKRERERKVIVRCRNRGGRRDDESVTGAMVATSEAWRGKVKGAEKQKGRRGGSEGEKALMPSLLLLLITSDDR